MAAYSKFRDIYSPYIDGEFVSGIEDIKVKNPANNEPVTIVEESGRECVDKAISSCHSASREWRETSGRKRGEILYDISSRLLEGKERLAKIETWENGRSISQARKRVEAAARYFEYYAGLADKIEGESIPVDGNRIDYTVKEPLGVTAQIIPWNSSLLLGARGLAPSLACGNTIVAKVDPKTPATVIELAHIANEVGLPDGVLNVLPGGVEHTGEPLTTDNRLCGIVFTGSVQGGQEVMKAAAENVVPVNLELGGKSPSIVFPDCDLEAAVEGTTNVFKNGGQVCFATTRVFVHESIYDEFLDKIVEQTEELSIGPGIEDNEIVPLASPQAQQRVKNHVDEAVSVGARLRTGGEIPIGRGNYFAPTILDNVEDDAKISCEEVFGPVITVYGFESESSVVKRANDTEYGLYGTIWTSKLDRAHRMADQIEAGTVSINEFPVAPVNAPFGGYKKSGIGREKGKQVIDHYTQLKNVIVNTGK